MPVVTVHGSSVIVDTGGTTETKAKAPADFATYYAGLPIAAALGADYLAAHAVQIGSFANANRKTIPLDVRSAHRQTAAFVTCRIGGRNLRLLLDTAALAWPSADRAHENPSGVIFLSAGAFAALQTANPAWSKAANAYAIVNERGHFVAATSTVAPQTDCAGIRRTGQVIVEREDATTFNYVQRFYHVTADSDISLAAFSGAALGLDFPHRTLTAEEPAGASAMFRADAAHLGVYRSKAPSLRAVQWRFHAGGSLVSSPVVADGSVYAGSNDGNLYALRQTDGTMRWRYLTHGEVTSSPAVFNGAVYFASTDGFVYAVDAQAGTLRWRFETGGERRFEAPGIHGIKPPTQMMADPFDLFISSPTIAANTVHIGSGDHNVYALDASSGAVRWKFQGSSKPATSPTPHPLWQTASSTSAVGTEISMRSTPRPARFDGSSRPATIKRSTIKLASKARLP